MAEERIQQMGPGKNPQTGKPQGSLNRGGNWGNKGGGRPKDEWKAQLQALASHDKVLGHIRAVLDKGPSDPFFESALNYVTNHGYGKAPQSVDVSGQIDSVITVKGYVGLDPEKDV